MLSVSGLAGLLLAVQAWSVIGPGSVTSSGLYTAPANPSGVGRLVFTHKGFADTSEIRFTAAGGSTVGIPFGLTSAPLDAMVPPYTFTLLAERTGVIAQLPELKRRKITVLLNLTNSGSCALDAAGQQFQMALWKACFDKPALPNRTRINAYGDSGTVVIYLIDEPNLVSRWGIVTPAMVEQMAAYSKSLFPRVPVVARVGPDWLGTAAPSVDGAWASYRANRGTIQDYVAEHKAAAKKYGKWIGISLNLLDGGTTDSTSPLFSGRASGTNAAGKPLYEMSAAEALTYGVVIIQARPCLMSGWEYRDTYLARLGMQAALDSLARMASRAPREC